MNTRRRQSKIRLNVKAAINIGVLMLVMTIMSYVYLVNAATFDTAKAQKISNEIAVLQSEIGELELAYMEKTRSISVDDGAGFALIQNSKESKKILVSRDSNTKLTLNE